MQVRAAIYARISKDRDGEALGVERQEADCRELAARLGWDVVAVFVDNDISASTRSKKPRPQYEEMLRAVKAGRIDAVLAYSNSRLTRRPAEWITLIELANAGRIRIKTVVSGGHDLSTADGRAVALTIAAWDAAEAERIGERVSRKKRQVAEAGKYRGGPRPYGYEKDGMTVRPAEAEVIREATKAILAGRSLAAVARELNEAGRRTSKGRTWSAVQLRDVLVRPRNAGLIHSGLAKRSDVEILGRAQWPAIVDEDTWRAVHAVLTDPSRRTQTNNDARWLGTNTYICDRDGCGATMRAAPISSRKGGRRYDYRCTAKNHLTIAAGKTDDYVRKVVAALVRDPRIVAALTEGDGGAVSADRERRAVLVASLDRTKAEWDADEIGTADYKRKAAKIEAEIEEIDARMASGLQRSAAAEVLHAPDPGAAFLSAPVDVQRAVVRTVVTVTVQPAAQNGQAWTSDRIVIGPVVESSADEMAEMNGESPREFART
ncbi:Site-specific DNA recombinase [Actinomadura meyerae]|uniref:Site-specific DNA recombinase n=1 Tax=Actinomadura meyerae TaxID=240840 RepID=A0A239BVC0_9ACTN|nr:Site-specific DNA recombinase [Actinomadura meyerae]